MNFASTALPPWSPANLEKKQSTVVRGIVSPIHKVKENNASISPSMCFFTSAVINGPTVNELLLIVEAFRTTSSLYFYGKAKQIVNVTTPIILKL
jgi:hypothetical protein